MRNTGVIVLVGSLLLSGLLLLVWLVGLVVGLTAGGLIHLLLVAAILIAPAGVLAGILIFVLGKRRG